MLESEYTLKVTPKAYEDLDEMYYYISNKLYNETAANHLLEKIETGIMRLKEFPFSCSVLKDELLKEKGYRKLIINKYIIFYLVREEEKEVVVMRVLYGAQKYQTFI